MTHVKQYPSLAYVAVLIEGCNCRHLGMPNPQPVIAVATLDPTEGLAVTRLGDPSLVNEIS